MDTPYFNTGNGPASSNDHGNSIVKLVSRLSSGGVYSFDVTAFSAAADDPSHAAQWRDNDIDLGGGGVAVIPGTTQLAGGGKTGVIYLMDRSTMAKVQSFDAFTNTYTPAMRYDDWMSGPHLHGAPTYWQVSTDRGYLFHWGEKDRLKRFTHDRSTGLIGATSPLPGDVVATPDLMPGGLVSLSAHGTSDGLLWITLPSYSTGRVFAYDALTMRRLWETEQLEGVSHNNPPTIAEGRVIVGGTNNAFVVYGLRYLQWLPPIEVQRRPPFPIPPDPGPWIREAVRAISPERAREITPPAGYRAVFLASGSGMLHYEARGAAGRGPLHWILAATSGPFIDQSGVMPQMAHGGLGHALATAGQGFLLSAHGSSRATLEPVATVAAPKPADAPWMLFRATPGEQQGVLADISHVQRLATKGGVTATAARKAGQRVEVPYEAMYVFYIPEGKLP
ncbi:MAG: DUF3455 domain-containing protein [Variovorax sp.]|nr:MAG: DUF3455 domain-containing protein [Variovorax sp.]